MAEVWIDGLGVLELDGNEVVLAVDDIVVVYETTFVELVEQPHHRRSIAYKLWVSAPVEVVRKVDLDVPALATVRY